MFAPSLSLSGAPRSGFELARGLAARGWRIDTYCAASGPTAALYEEGALPLHFTGDLSVSQSAPRAYERDVESLAAFLTNLAPPLVYANTLDLFPVIDAARLAGIPSIWNIRESEPWRGRLADRHPAVAARALAAFHYPAKVIFVAEAARAAWARFTREDNTTIIYNAPFEGAPAAREDRQAIRAALGVQTGDTLFVSAGTICARKGQLDIAGALAKLPCDVLSRIRVALVGEAEAPYLAKLRLALSPEAGDRIAFTGAVPDGPAYVAAADVLLNTSRSEAFPRTFIEAAASGVAIIAANVGGAAERLDDGVSALFYAPGDVDRLCAHITALAGDPAQRSSLAAAARASLVSSWSFDEMILAYEECIGAAGAS